MMTTETGTFKSYISGFILSMILTFASFYLVIEQWLTGHLLILTIMGFGLAQALVQLTFFLHLGEEPKPRWNMIVFLFMALVLVIIVFGTLWIMYNLNERVMPTMGAP